MRIESTHQHFSSTYSDEHQGGSERKHHDSDDGNNCYVALSPIRRTTPGTAFIHNHTHTNEHLLTGDQLSPTAQHDINDKHRLGTDKYTQNMLQLTLKFEHACCILFYTVNPNPIRKLNSKLTFFRPAPALISPCRLNAVHPSAFSNIGSSSGRCQSGLQLALQNFRHIHQYLLFKIAVKLSSGRRHVCYTRITSNRSLPY